MAVTACGVVRTGSADRDYLRRDGTEGTSYCGSFFFAHGSWRQRSEHGHMRRSLCSGRLHVPSLIVAGSKERLARQFSLEDRVGVATPRPHGVDARKRAESETGNGSQYLWRTWRGDARDDGCAYSKNLRVYLFFILVCMEGSSPLSTPLYRALTWISVV
jgi:hypothetical protein